MGNGTRFLTQADRIIANHSGWSGVGCSSSELATVGHWPAEYYGLQMSIFSGDCPSQAKLEYIMQWQKEQWIAGNKAICAELVSI